ncbi:hypothetical protein [Limoniibacter endophyticus]|uniref:Uncharacterized protein n=1 Tax=Limoniibacter endophyticus TaxID=1565040 RepID=A0A8J3DFI0_9HYPH|nr:hypothetical protein [Limoniibacter endophyticus]GHC61279.1 hypothetical protein GCM10010136_01740 [Limoniibacter endophyticus]
MPGFSIHRHSDAETRRYAIQTMALGAIVFAGIVAVAAIAIVVKAGLL